MRKFFLKHKIGTIEILVSLITMVTACSPGIKNNVTLSTVRLIHNIPSVRPDGELYNFSDSVTIAYRDSIILYQVPYSYEYAITKDSAVSGIKYTYFVYQRNEKYGYKYDSTDDPTPKKSLVDSFLRKYAFGGYPFDNLSGDSLLEVNTNDRKNDRIEKYIPKFKPDFTYPDTSLYFYNSQLNNINYSFSKRLDSLNKMKLVRIRFIFNAAKITGYTFELPTREFAFELKKAAIADQQKVLVLLNNFPGNSKNR